MLFVREKCGAQKIRKDNLSSILTNTNINIDGVILSDHYRDLGRDNL